MADRTPEKACADDRDAGAGAEAELVAQRLCAIVHGVEGRNVDANGEELWFEPTSASGVQVRLSGDSRARCYDRSANFAISYGGQPSDAPVSSAFRKVVECIKTIDGSPIDGVATAFRAAAQVVVRRCANPGADRTGQGDEGDGDVQRGTSPGRAVAPPPSAPGDAVDRTLAAGSTVFWENPRTRELNVIFLDLCAQLAGRHGEALLPLHWGFWPIDAPPPATGAQAYDPQGAFSENLLAYIPDGVSRILDVGCGLGFNAKLLAARNKRVTALSPVAHHCALIENAQLPGVEVRCARFEELSPGQRYDLLLFSESLNHFSLDEDFLQHCRRFLVDSGFMLMADDLTEERARLIETQRVFRVLRSVDITDNVAPTTQWWARQMPVVAAYHNALMSTLELYDPALAAGVRAVIGALDNNELKVLFSGQMSPPLPKGRYMIYLLQSD